MQFGWPETNSGGVRLWDFENRAPGMCKNLEVCNEITGGRWARDLICSGEGEIVCAEGVLLPWEMEESIWLIMEVVDFPWWASCLYENVITPRMAEHGHSEGNICRA